MKELNFNSAADVADYVRDTSSRSESRKMKLDSWNPASFEDALKMLTVGWPDGTAKMNLLVENLTDMLAHDEEVSSWQYDVSGEMIDIGAYLSGVPECMFREEIVTVKKDSLKIRVFIGAGQHTSGQSIMNRGAVIMSVIDVLRSKYHLTVEIVENLGVTYGLPEPFRMTVKMDTENFYSRDLLAFCVGHPSFLRRIVFASMEHAFHTDNCGYYGSPQNVPYEEGVLYFPLISPYQYDTVAQSYSTMRSILSKYITIEQAA